jgi:hypothetical protein
MNDLLSKFDNVEINNADRIAKEDKEFCVKEQESYDDSIELYEKCSNAFSKIKSIKDWKSKYIRWGQLNVFGEEMMNAELKFVCNIVQYFVDKYKVTLDDKIIVEKYNYKEITYNIIIEEIFVQLGGFSFTEKQENEIKSALIEEMKYDVKYDRIKIKNNKISVSDFYHINYFSKRWGNYEVDYSSDEKFHKLLSAMSYFMFRDTRYLNNLYDTITREKNDDVFKTHDVTSNGILTLKLYKNGKIDIEFSNPKCARQFVKEYCGYMEH